LTSSIKDHLLEAAWADLPPMVKDWGSHDEVRTSLEAWLSNQLAWCEDLAFAQRFHANCPVEGASPEDYLQRILPTATGERILTGIRFRGRNRDFPFVDLIASTASLHPAEQLKAAIDAIEDAFSKFAPRSVRILRSSAAEPLSSPRFSSSHDQMVIAGRVSALASRPAPRFRERVTFDPIRDPAEGAAFVAEAYEDFFEAEPAMRGVIYPADSSDLAPCAEVSCLGYLVIDGKRAGVIAAKPAVKYTLRGHEVVEEILTTSWRGKGFAAAAQRALIDRLSSREQETVLFGTISTVNQASQKTALRVGREVVASYLFLSRPT